MPKEIIEMRENLYTDNEILAEKVRENLSAKSVFAINILGGAGAGKTSVLKNIISRLNYKAYVVEGDIESDIDTQTLLKLGVETYQINTHGTCHLDAAMMQAIVRKMAIREKGYLFVENIGNLVCPADYVIGEHIKILICSVPEGSDKPYKYPLAFQKASAIVLSKTDLLPYIEFDKDFFYKGVRALNQEAPIFETSSKNGEGFEPLTKWLIELAGI
jgi:hydrogenase nickel incorporation protein HypB